MTTTSTAQSFRESARGLAYLFVLGVVAYPAYAIYAAIDSSGWIPHREDGVITAQANWFVGESKDCMSYPLDIGAARTLHKMKGDAITKISCDDGPDHNVKITFWGRTEQPEYSWVRWQCTRNEGSFTCKQVGNSEAVLTGKDVKTGRPIISYDGGKTWQWDSQQ